MRKQSGGQCSAHETIRLILYAARQGRAVASGALPRKGRRYKGKRRVQAHILQGLPGVGPERAKRLLEQFGSVEAVVAANEAELTSVQGIGQGTAQAIRWSVEETQTLYGNDDSWNDPVL
ncbi:MAG: helix-hairpin-helix domain-containing protein [Pseudomonadota bacterium]